MTLDGLTALSVEIITNTFVPKRPAASARLRVPRTFVFTASAVQLHQGHVLVGGGVEDNAGAVLWKMPLTLGLSLISAISMAKEPRRLLLQLQPDVVDAVFAVAQQHQLFGVDCGHLAASSEPMEPPAP